MLPSKSENLSDCSTKLIHVCKKLPLVLDCSHRKYSPYNFETNIFPILGVPFAISFLRYFQKLLVVKKNLKWLFLHWNSVGMSSESLSQIFEILFQTANTDTFAFHGVFFSRSVREKTPLFDDAVKSETHFSR